MTRYYYAGGRRIALEADPDLVAIDEKRAGASGVPPSTGDAAARRLPGGVTVVARSEIDAERLSSLRDAGALRPVYRHGGALMVPLPEIRVEVDNPTEHKAVMRALDGAPHQVVVASESDDGIVLAPVSGTSDDAIEVANYVYETARPAAASVRFVQFVPRPSVTRK